MASSNDLPVSESAESSSNKSKDTFWTPGRIMITLLGAALIIWYGIARWGSNNAPATTANTTVAARTAPVNNPPAAPVSAPIPQQLRDTALQTLDGGSVKLSDFSDKVIVLNIWATWCGPCRLEMPELIKISNEYKSRGLVVLGLATSYNERNDQQHVKDYIKAQNVPYPIIWDDGTLAEPLVEAVRGRSVIPQSFVISRDGKIVDHFQGFTMGMDDARARSMGTGTPSVIRQAIEGALNEKSKA